MTRPDLRSQVERFAASLTSTLRAVLGDDAHELTAAEMGESRFVVTTAQPGGYVLTVGGEPFLVLRVRFLCGWDAPRRFTRVDRSEIHLLPAGNDTRPLIRYEYGPTTPRLPSAHVHVHTDDPRIVEALASAGARTSRSKRHAKSAAKGKSQTADLHLPLGGPRFRPPLEDVLHMVVEEFGVDAPDGWHTHLADGREGWRRIQTKAVVRDAPEDAAEALRSMGYEVTLPDDEERPGDTLHRLREL